LLEASAKRLATRTIGKRSPRMVKRRNSVYAAHNRTLPIRIPIDCTPRRLDPPPLSAKQWFPAFNII
jgi:hypothetical protein